MSTRAATIKKCVHRARKMIHTEKDTDGQTEGDKEKGSEGEREKGDH